MGQASYEELVEDFRSFFREEYKERVAEARSGGHPHVLVDCAALEAFNPQLFDALTEENGDEVIDAAEDALEDLSVTGDANLRVRFFNLPERRKIAIRHLRSRHLHNLIAVTGIVRRASEVRPEIIAARFRCKECGTVIEKEQESTKLKSPYKCSGCGGKNFDVKKKVMRDVQVLTVEESPEERGGTAHPKRIIVFLRDELVDREFEKRVRPGSKVTITGTLQELPNRKKNEKQYDLGIEASYVEPVEQEFEEITISGEEERDIQELAQEDNIFHKLTQSVAPSIYGLEEIKKAVTLQLFGGVRKKRKDGHVIRGDIHLLLIGEPGTAKSQMLKFASNLAPKGKYVVGKSATSAGITATVVKDEVTNNWALEAGALVLAHNGMAMIDEIDKMSDDDRSALHEAMEQQHITVSKASIHATLQCKTAILAAGNPKYGRFDPFGNIAEQIDLTPTLISRFDLIFPLKDLPDKDKDKKLADHILDLHKDMEEKEAAIDTSLLKKYIAYARRNVEPDLSDAAMKKIKQFYLELRAMGSESGEARSVPITARQLEALVRMAEASAKTRLSETVEEKDAKRAIDLLTYYLKQIGMDPETEQIDIDKIEVGMSGSERNKLRTVMNVIRQLSQEQGEEVTREEIKNRAEEKSVEKSEVDRIIQQLLREGEIYQPRDGVLSLI